VNSDGISGNDCSGEEKAAVRAFWNAAACGETLLLEAMTVDGFKAQAAERYRLEPYIVPFAGFVDTAGLKVLEVGLGLGADHERFARAGAELHGIDLTGRAVEITTHRLALNGLVSEVWVGDAEALPYPDDFFDWVYSWGVIHHSPDTSQAAREILRVLKPGGEFRVMVYHRWSLVGAMLWFRYGLMRGRPWLTLDEVYAKYLESPGTKAYTCSQGAALFSLAQDVQAWTVLTHGDLLESGAGQRHQGQLLTLARRFWPRWLLRRICKGCGLFLMIKGRKPKR